MKTGVQPLLSAVLASAAYSCTSARTVSVWPFLAAVKTGVQPSFKLEGSVIGNS